MDRLSDRIQLVLNLSGLSREQFASTLGVTQAAVSNWLQGGGVSQRNIWKIHDSFSIPIEWLVQGRGDAPRAAKVEKPDSQDAASAHSPVHLEGMIPVFGQAEAGDDGRFILNGNRIADVVAPPSLRGVRDAYAVYVVGDSMEPRYLAGEAVYVNPRLPVRRGDFVVVQVAGDEGDPPAAYIKRFISKDAANLSLEQFNPAKKLRIPVSRLVSVHRIVMSGDG